MTEALSTPRRPSVIVLISGGGTTAEAYAEAIHNNEVQHDITAVISNNPGAAGLARPERWNRDWGFDTETAVIDRATYPGDPNLIGQTREEAEAMTQFILDRRPTLVVALGFMAVLQEPFIDTFGYVPERHTSVYQARALNTHPGTLPRTQGFMGLQASTRMLVAYHAHLIDHAEHTLHAIAAEVDKGPVIARNWVDIESADNAETLNARVQKVKKANIAGDIDSFLSGQRTYELGQRALAAAAVRRKHNIM